MIGRFSGTHAFLSNFYQAPTWYEGLLFPTSEHAYQAAKTLDTEERLQILKCATPAIAKRLGRALTLRKNWELIKVQEMYSIVYSKFQVEHLRELLLRTGDAELVEGNTWHDNFWGDCCCGSRTLCLDPGLNTLGIILMEIRWEVAE